MRKILIILLNGIALLLITACGPVKTDKNVDFQENGSSEIVEENNDVVKESTLEKIDVIREKAIFVNLVDSDTIEVDIESERMLLITLNPLINIDFGTVNSDADVIIEYFINKRGQNELTHFEIVKE